MGSVAGSPNFSTVPGGVSGMLSGFAVNDVLDVCDPSDDVAELSLEDSEVLSELRDVDSLLALDDVLSLELSVELSLELSVELSLWLELVADEEVDRTAFGSGDAVPATVLAHPTTANSVNVVIPEASANRRRARGPPHFDVPDTLLPLRPSPATLPDCVRRSRAQLRRPRTRT